MVPRILLPLIGMTLLAAVIMAEDVTESPCTSVDECNTCTNEQLKCTACSYREALLVDGSGCNDCGSNCAECVDEGTAGSPDIKCTECFVGYVLNAEKECTECSTGCQYCNTTSDSTVCHTCYEPNGLDKYYARNDVDGTCLQCPTNCKKCSVQITDGVASTVCSDCIESYALNSDKVCKSCPMDCVKCSVNGDGVSICSECDTGYVLDKTEGANKCLVCDCGEVGLCNGEQRTTSISKCSGCPDGKYLTASEACLSCTGGCKTCETSSANCLTCEDGTYATGDLPGPCSFCVSNCDECKDGATCDTCDESYGVAVSDLICEVCVDANCDFCDDDAAVCKSCEDGYYFDEFAATKCTSCADPNCKTCNGAADMCTVCNGDWRVWENGCVDRTCADPNCLICANPVVCTDCPEGFKLDNNMCIACDITNCADCDADTMTCAMEKCKAGYGRIDTGGTITCEKCTIAECTRCDGNKDQCEAMFCIEGYTVDAMVCAQCDIINCGDCDAAKATCATGACKSGYGHIDTSGTITCDACDNENCAVCDTTLTTCTACKKGYTVKADDTCEACSDNLDGCAECDDPPTMCDKCQSDLVKNSAGTACYTCGIAGCTACSANGKCESTGCMEGYKYKSSDMSCVQCDVNCDTANPTSCTLESDGSTSCSLCNSGYILNTDTNACEICDENCGTSSGDCTYTTGDGVKCGTCAVGYHSNGVTCDACPSGCATCPPQAGELVCATCIASRKENRKENGDVCVRCPNDCEECSETDGVMICSKCADQFTLNSEGNECKACPGQCNKCAYSGGNVICQECQSGTGLSGNRQSCTACSTLTFADCATCTSADSNEVATCLSCRGSYTLRDDGNACTACSPLTDCSVCEDKPYECSSCKEGFSETEDHLCAHLCYTCEGNRESCGDFDFVGLSNSTEACFEGACVAVWDKTTDIHHRGCANVTCSPSNVERCDGDTCTRCCEGDKCNNWTLTGMSGATAISQTLAFVMVTLAALGLLK